MSLRHCCNENVTVYEAHDKDISSLLRRAADSLKTIDSAWVNLSLGFNNEGDYVLSVYVHE